MKSAMSAFDVFSSIKKEFIKEVDKAEDFTQKCAAQTSQLLSIYKDQVDKMGE